MKIASKERSATRIGRHHYISLFADWPSARRDGKDNREIKSVLLLLLLILIPILILLLMPMPMFMFMFSMNTCGSLRAHKLASLLFVLFIWPVKQFLAFTGKLTCS